MGSNLKVNEIDAKNNFRLTLREQKETTDDPLPEAQPQKV
jgi:hypothetical protein